MKTATIGLALALAGTTAQAETRYVIADRMLDVETGTYRANPLIAVEDGKIVAVGSGAAPAGANVVDLRGHTILPGLIDMHVHLTGSARIRGYRSLEYTDAFWPTLGVGNARDMLRAGFTTVRNLGSADYADVALKQGIDGGFYPGPRIVPATWSFGATGGHCGGSNLLPPSYKEQTERGSGQG